MEEKILKKRLLIITIDIAVVIAVLMLVANGFYGYFESDYSASLSKFKNPMLSDKERIIGT